MLRAKNIKLRQRFTELFQKIKVARFLLRQDVSISLCLATLSVNHSFTHLLNHSLAR